MKFYATFMFPDNLLQDTYFIFQTNVDYFEVAHKTYPVLVWSALPL